MTGLNLFIKVKPKLSFVIFFFNLSSELCDQVALEINVLVIKSEPIPIFIWSAVVKSKLIPNPNLEAAAPVLTSVPLPIQTLLLPVVMASPA